MVCLGSMDWYSQGRTAGGRESHAAARGSSSLNSWDREPDMLQRGKGKGKSEFFFFLKILVSFIRLHGEEKNNK